MRFGVVLTTLALLVTNCRFMSDAGACDSYATPQPMVWVDGSWQSSGGGYVWTPGRWQTTTVTTTSVTRQTTYSNEERVVYHEPRYAPPVVYTPPPCRPTPPPVVYSERPCERTTVVVTERDYHRPSWARHCEQPRVYRQPGISFDTHIHMNWPRTRDCGDGRR